MTTERKERIACQGNNTRGFSPKVELIHSFAHIVTQVGQLEIIPIHLRNCSKIDERELICQAELMHVQIR